MDQLKTTITLIGFSIRSKNDHLSTVCLEDTFELSNPGQYVKDMKSFVCWKYGKEALIDFKYQH